MLDKYLRIASPSYLSSLLFNTGGKITSKLGPLGKFINNNPALTSHTMLGAGLGGATAYNRDPSFSNVALSSLIGGGLGNFGSRYGTSLMYQNMTPNRLKHLREFSKHSF